MGRYNQFKNTSRLMAVLLVLTLLVSIAPRVQADEYSGECGDNLTWSFSAGTLTITGSGAMSDFPESEMAPWYGLRDQILRLSLPEGLTAIGELAFYDCDYLTAVTIPDSVETIGAYAFAECSGMEMLDLGSVKSVGQSAFSDCVSLQALRLPDSLTSIGIHGFYRCESITTITIPASVTDLGVCAFGYCKSLVTARIEATISEIPELLFHGCVQLASVTIGGTAEDIGDFAFRGCDSLSVVYHDGNTMTSEQIRDMVSADLSGFKTTGHVTDTEPSDISKGGYSQDNGDGTVTQVDTSVSEDANITISTTVTTTYNTEDTGNESSAKVNVTIDGEDGWEDAQHAVENALSSYNENTSANGTQSQQIEVNVYVQNSDQVDTAFINALAGRDIVVTVTTANGSVWKIPCKDVGRVNSGAFDLAYELTAASPELCEELETNEAFVLRFLSATEVNAEVMISLGASRVGQNAVLFQQKGSRERIQTVVVDQKGYAHFYLASVDDETEYYIAMNLSDENNEAIIPQELLNYYGNPIRTTPLEYEITGRTSSWNMSLNQVTWIMAGIIGATVVTVGIVVFMFNKRKLKMGYVPDLEEEET